jgi:hypothetical protein
MMVGWMTQIKFVAGLEIFLFAPCIQTGSGVYSFLYPVAVFCQGKSNLVGSISLTSI